MAAIAFIIIVVLFLVVYGYNSLHNNPMTF